MSDTDSWSRLHADFRWHVPARFNIADVCARRWATDLSRIALIVDDGSDAPVRYGYAALMADANRLSNALRALGIGPGDRVAIVLPQRAETAVAHLALYQLGAVAMPLSVLFGPEALAFRLADSGAKAAICEDAQVERLADLAATTCPQLRRVIAVGAGGTPALDWSALLARASDRFLPVDTAADDPAVLIYTSGTTGAPKGALIPHRALIGNLPGFVASQDWFPRSGDVFWSPADWAWTGGLMDALLPTLYFGFPIVASRERFDPERALALLARHGVTNSFLFPTALKLLMKATVPAGLRLRALMSAGESVGPAVFEWAERSFGLQLNEMFGQTEVNYVVGNSSRRWPARPGAMGRPYPGHRVAVIDDDGRELAAGTVGEVAVHRRDRHGDRDPVFFLGYLGQDAPLPGRFTGDPDDSWFRTGDLARRDEDGYLWYEGRADDVFKSSGYRIGPGEIEHCLLAHPAVLNAAVVPKPDAERGAVVKAFVVLAPDAVAGVALVEALQAHVRGRLAPYEYPKEIEFVAELPLTTTGKLRRRVLRELEVERTRQGG